jgi:hypothetical protein
MDLLVKKKSQGSFFYYYFSSSYRRNYQRDQCNRISVAPYFKSIQHIITTERRYEPACRFQKSHPGYREIYIHIYEKKNGDSYLQQLLEKVESPRKEKIKRKKKKIRNGPWKYYWEEEKEKKKSISLAKKGRRHFLLPLFAAEKFRFFKHTQEYI